MKRQSKERYIDSVLYCNKFNDEDNTFKVFAVYSKGSHVDARAISDEYAEIKIYDPYKGEVSDLDDTSYEIDADDFAYFEKGYEIDYMTMEWHYNLWSAIIEQKIENFENQDGIQKYLSYCKDNGVTKESIEYANALSIKFDVIDAYLEGQYKNISEFEKNGTKIILSSNEKEKTFKVEEHSIHTFNDRSEATSLMTSRIEGTLDENPISKAQKNSNKEKNMKGRSTKSKGVAR